MVRSPIKNEPASGQETAASPPPDEGDANPADEDLDDSDESLSEVTSEGDYADTDGLTASKAPGRDVYFTNARDGLNLRSGPGTEFSIVRSLPLGTQVHLVKREGRWGLVDQQGDGATDGFVHLAFLSESVSSDTHSSLSLTADQVWAFWAQRNPRHARLYDVGGNPLVDPRLLQASAAAVIKLESQSPNYRIEIYGPNGGLRDGGRTKNHTAQPGTGRGAAIDYVIIDLNTGKMLTNNPGSAHQHQGTVGENAPLYQSFFNEVVRQGSQLYSPFGAMARFGGYFKDDNPMDTMHIDLRSNGHNMGGGSLRGGFTHEQMKKWGIPENRPYT